MGAEKPEETTSTGQFIPGGGGFLGLHGWPKWLLLWALWTALGVSEGARQYFEWNLTTQYFTWTQAISWGLAIFYLWWILSFVIFRLTKWIGFGDLSRLKKILLHLCAAAVISFVQVFLYSLIDYGLDLLFFHEYGAASITYGRLFATCLRSMPHTALLIYSLIAFVSYTVTFYRRYHEEEMRLTRTRAELAQAQLNTLKMQLHPHFLYNALNAITALILTDRPAAAKITGRLAGLLRTTLENERVHETSLQKELDFLDRYLEIQQIRFYDRLQVSIDIAPETRAALVPNLILQPLVENAIKHGICRRAGNGVIRISAHRDGELLHLSIADDGPGLGVNESRPFKDGRGLANTRNRLRNLYGDRHEFKLQENGGRGLCVSISIPFRTEPGRKTEIERR